MKLFINTLVVQNSYSEPRHALTKILVRKEKVVFNRTLGYVYHRVRILQLFGEEAYVYQ